MAVYANLAPPKQQAGIKPSQPITSIFQRSNMKELTVAQQLIQSWYTGDAPVQYYKHAGPTPGRKMRKGEDGSRKPGGYGKGLRNWITRTQAAAMANKR